MNPANGVETLAAQSTITYDEPAFPILTYGSVTGWVDPAPAVRGNPTTTGMWLDTTGGELQAHAQYDQLGNLRKAYDGKGNVTQVDFASAYQYAYPSTTTSAVPDVNGTYGSMTPLVSTNVYDLNTGLVVSSTDANGNVTSFDHTDPFERMKMVTRPDLGQTAYIYNDVPGSVYVETLTKQDATRSVDSFQFCDGLGRPNRSFLNVGTGNYITTDTQYDNLGRAYRISNPYLSNGSASSINPSGLWTTSEFDALGRLITVTTPDGAHLTSQYGASTGATLGTTVTVTDQALKNRRSLTDALGRLVRVDEPTAAGLGTVSSPNQPTSYQYDVLGNIRKVTQGQQQRFFMYDSLSRLLRARSPEQVVNPGLNLNDSNTGNSQWTMSYAYDNNGNLTSRVDARGVTATYAYDALNRNKTVVYTNDAANTPAASRYYDGWRDGNFNGSITNSKGRVWQTETSGSLSTRVTIDGYDAVGHPQQLEQNFYTSSGWSPSYTVGRTYDKVGHVLTQTYPSGHTVTYNYDQTGRLADQDAQNLAFTGNLGDGVTRTYLSGLSYDPAGRMTEEKYGTLTPLYHKQHFNVRGQLYDIRLGTAPWATDQWSWDRGAIINYYSYQNFTAGYMGTDNNGNLTRSENWIPGGDCFQDRYTYDELNRLKSVTEFQNGSSSSFAQTYKYDIWGNRTIDIQNNATWGSQINAVQTTADVNTNRLFAVNDPNHTVIDYDGAGNQTKDYLTWNGLRTYDAENRIRTATNSATNTYTYDADGRRTRRNLGGTEMWQVYGLDSELVAEYSAGAAPFVPHQEYGYRSGQLLVTAANGDEGRLLRFTTHYYQRSLNRNPT